MSTTMARTIVNQLYRLPAMQTVWGSQAERSYKALMRKPKARITTLYNLALKAREAK